MHHITGCAAEAQMRTTGLAKGAECRESTLPSVSGEKHSLDIPFYRTRQNVGHESGQVIFRQPIL